MKKTVFAMLLVLVLSGCSLVRPISTIKILDDGTVEYQGPKTETASLKTEAIEVKFDRKGEPLLDKAVGIKALLSVGDHD